MKIKRIITSLVLVLCLMLPVFAFAGCGNKEKAVYCWGKEFSWQNGMVVNDLEASFSQNGPTQKALLTREFIANNLDLTNMTYYYTRDGVERKIDLGEVEVGATTVKQLLDAIYNFVFQEFAKYYKDMTVKVGQKDENKITINGVDYSLQYSSGDMYNILDNETNNVIGYMISRMSRVNNFETEDCLWMNIYNNTLVVTIPTIEPKDDMESNLSGTASKLSISYNAYLTVVG